MNKLLALKSGLACLVSLLLVCLCALPAVAGEWVLEGYYWSGSSEWASVARRRHPSGENYYFTDRNKNVARNRLQRDYGPSVPASAFVSTDSSDIQVAEGATKSNSFNTTTASVGSSVYTVFVWRRNSQTYYDVEKGEWITIPDSADNPPSHIYVREVGQVWASAGTYDSSGYSSASSPLWQGSYEITGTAMGESLGERYRPERFPNTSWLYKDGRKTQVRKIAVSNDRAVVPSQSFSGEIQLLAYEENEIYPKTSAYVGFSYDADPLNFSLNASGFTAANRKQTEPNTEEIDAMVELRWLSPDNLETGENGEDKIVPSRNQARAWWKDYLGGEEIDDGAPIPYFAGQATFSVTATGKDGRTPIFDSQTYTWTPEDNTDPFDPDGNGTPGFVESSPSQRSYVWNFGSANDDEGSFPQTSTVSVELKSGNPDDDAESLTETKTINWYSVWSPTETGLQKNVVTPQFEWLTLPDGSPINAVSVKAGDTILCFVQGDPGFSTDDGRVEKIRPVPFDNQVPGPGERIEPRVVGRVTPVGNDNNILNFESTPQVNPDDDPNAPGYEDIQKAREVAAANQQAYQTGKSLTKTAIELQLEVYKAMAFGPAEGVAIEQAIKGVVAIGQFAEASRALKAITPVLEEGAEASRLASKTLRAAERDAAVGAKGASRMEKVAVDVERQGAKSSQLAKDSKGITTNGETYNARALEKLKREGCFVAGTLVWMGDGTLKPIEQVKVGALVLSKNEKTGEVTTKNVSHVSVRADIWTRKLTFDNGAVLETTDEHPLYVDGRGFVKAKEVGIGNSIVTRAGPSAKVVAVQADVRRATVYNFTVDALHTYFVGQDAWWVHNAGNCTWDLAVNDVQNASTKLKGSTNGLGPNHPDYNPYVVPSAEEAVRDAMRIAGSPNLKFVDEGLRNAEFKVRTPIDQYGKFWQIRYLRDAREVGPDELAHINVEKINAATGAVMENNHINWRGRDTGSFDIEGFFKAIAD